MTSDVVVVIDEPGSVIVAVIVVAPRGLFLSFHG
jgi:hypothetical protein